MDRQIVYPGAIPLETDLLNTNRNVMVALGRLMQDVLGTSTLVSGLACTPTAPASMSVQIGAGSLYSQQNIDNTAYSSLAADTADQIVKQGILLASANKTLTMTAPTTPGYSVIYLIEAAYSEVDGGATVLQYYNASNPAVAYSGPNNTGASNFTVRQGAINLVAKAGIAAASPTAPAADTGFVPLYYVTIAYGATTITSGNITVAPTAPFLPSGVSGTTGQVSYFASTTAPTGFLKCNGAAISRAVYSGLFAAIGTTFGAGDGSTTFNLPDLRGEFLRGFDDGRGVDSGRSLGSSQAGQNLSHHHASPTASSSTAGNYEVAISAGTSVSGTVVGGFSTYDYSGGAGAIAYTDYDGGSEARPRNIALLACIKY